MRNAVIVLAVVAAGVVVVLLMRRSAAQSTPAMNKLPFRMPIEDIFSLKTPGSVVVVGVIAEGEVRPGDALIVQTGGDGIRVRVQAMETYPAGADRSIRLERAGKGNRVGVMLDGIEKDQIKAGDLLAAAPSGPASSSLDTPPPAGQTKTPHEWRTNPRLAGRFHPDYPHDLQVIVHDGGPRITKHRPELVWVRVTGCAGDIFSGRVLNAPTQLTGVRQSQEIRFLTAGGSEHPVLVTDKYLAERGNWTIIPCNKCGFSELFDAPSDLMKVIFPRLPCDSTVESFTSFCPLCGGVQVVHSRPPTAAGPAGSQTGR